MKRYIKSSYTEDWPDSEFWESYKGREEDIYYPYKNYLEGPELELAKEFKVSIEFYGEDIILHDLQGERNPIEIDALDWCHAEIYYASISNSEDEYKRRFRAFMKKRLEWWVGRKVSE